MIRSRYFPDAARCFADIPNDSDKIEVPADIYDEAADSPDAKKNFLRGTYPYEAVKIIAQSERVEALKFNAASGEITTSSTVGISAETEYAFAVWNFYDRDSAIERVILSRLGAGEQAENVKNLAVEKEDTFIEDLAKQAAGDIFKRMYNKFSDGKGGGEVNIDIVKPPQFAQKIGEVFSTIGDEIIIFMRHGEDISNLLRGRISGKQFVKNTALTLISLTVAGTAVSIAPIGGAILTFCQMYAMKTKGREFAKRFLDRFIKDDSERMLKIFEAELAGELAGKFLTKYEFILLNAAICDDLSKDFLQDMYARGNDTSRAAFARAHVQKRLDDIFRQRIFVEMPSTQDWINGLMRVRDKISRGEDIFDDMERRRANALSNMRAQLKKYGLKPHEIGHAVEAVNDINKILLEGERVLRQMIDSTRLYEDIHSRQIAERDALKNALRELS